MTVLVEIMAAAMKKMREKIKTTVPMAVHVCLRMSHGGRQTWMQRLTCGLRTSSDATFPDDCEPFYELDR